MENNPRGREAALLVFVVFLLGVLLGGVADHIYGHVVARENARVIKERPKQEVIDEFTHKLSLSPAQQQQLGVIISQTRSRWRDLYAPLETQHEQIRQEGRAKIRAMLTPEQIPQFEQFMKEMDQRRQKEKERQEADK